MAESDPAYEIETRKALACRAFWSDHALNVEYRTTIGDRSFTLKEFVTFVVTMSPEVFLAKQGILR